MKINSLIISLFVSVFIFGCSGSSGSQTNSGDKGKKVALDPVAPVPVQNIEAAKLKELIASANAPVLLDVRTPGEWSEGIISGATKIDFQGASFKDEIAKLDKSKNYVVYCAAGGRSSKAADQMANMGFSNVSNLVGGMGSWQSNGGGVVKP